MKPELLYQLLGDETLARCAGADTAIAIFEHLLATGRDDLRVKLATTLAERSFTVLGVEHPFNDLDGTRRRLQRAIDLLMPSLDSNEVISPRLRAVGIMPEWENCALAGDVFLQIIRRLNIRFHFEWTAVFFYFHYYEIQYEKTASDKQRRDLLWCMAEVTDLYPEFDLFPTAKNVIPSKYHFTRRAPLQQRPN